MLCFYSLRQSLGFERFPATMGRGTIPAADARHDDVNDMIGAKLRQLWQAQQSAHGWGGECERHRRDVEQLCAFNGYAGLWVDPRDYLVNIVGQSLLYDVPTDKRGNLAPFAGKRIRVACTRSGTFRRVVWIGAFEQAELMQPPDQPKHMDAPGAWSGDKK